MRNRPSIELNMPHNALGREVAKRFGLARCLHRAVAGSARPNGRRATRADNARARPRRQFFSAVPGSRGTPKSRVQHEHSCSYCRDAWECACATPIVTASFLISKLNLKDANELRSWIQKLLELGIVISTDTRSKAKEYRIDADILRKGQYKGRTSLKRIEPYRLRELILTDLSIHKKSKIADINKRIGEEIAQRKIWLQLKKLVDEGLVRIIGQSRWTEYEMIESSI